jgi:hypothetical protein
MRLDSTSSGIIWYSDNAYVYMTIAVTTCATWRGACAAPASAVPWPCTPCFVLAA